MKKLGLHNWREPEVPISFPGLQEDIWVKRVLAPKLIEAVPEDVIRLFEVARGSMLYGWFFYPLLTLANEQLDRVHEAAVRHRCKAAGIATQGSRGGKIRDRNFGELIDELVARGVIPNEAVPQWDAVRKLRNHSSHPKSQMIIPPGLAVGGIDSAARRINQLFSGNPDYFSDVGVRVRIVVGLERPNRVFPVVVGIDVGDSKKGFHLVALRGGHVFGVTNLTDPTEAAEWCSGHEATIVGVAAPCGWSRDDESRGRDGERMLAALGHSAHSTPSRARAQQNAFYEWMLNGERLYQALETDYPLFRGSPTPTRYCFETYPHLAACALAGRRLKAGDKVTDRRDLIRGAGIDDARLTNIDFIDAAICALVAYSADLQDCTMYGDASEGYILVPGLF